MDTASLDVGPLASSFVDLGPGAGPKARKRELVIHRHLRDATEPERQQRGAGFFMHLFDDLCKAGSAYAEEKKQKPVCDLVRVCVGSIWRRSRGAR